MTNEERVNKFKNEDIVINCETKEEAEAFIGWCFANNLKWANKDDNGTYFENYNANTCYSYSFHDAPVLGYDYSEFYIDSGWEVIKYKDFMKGKERKMTNLEYVVSKKLIDIAEICNLAHRCKYGCRCADKICQECEFADNIDLCVQTILEKHCPIKLKQWEYDLIATNNMSRERPFESFATYRNMKNMGYFESIKDTSMTLKEILDNCEIVE